MQKCYGPCGQILSEDKFTKNKASRTGLNHICKVCQRQYNRNNYNKNKSYYISKSVQRQKLLLERINKIKLILKGCQHCGEECVHCLDFHHIDPTKKIFEIADGYRRYAWTVVMEEIIKCVLLCSNCHRKLHAGLIQCSCPIGVPDAFIATNDEV